MRKHKVRELQRMWNTREKGNYYPFKPYQMNVTAAVVTGMNISPTSRVEQIKSSYQKIFLTSKPWAEPATRLSYQQSQEEKKCADVSS